MGLEDMWDLIEVLMIDAHNDRAMAKYREKQNK
jgi:hypothetical protein